MIISTQIAVVAIIVHNSSCLLLHRNNPPKNWCPPCGRVRIQEEIISALQREVYEETALTINPILPVEVWQGTHDSQPILSITYVCSTNKKGVQLSSEHSEYQWIPISELSTKKINTDFNTKSWPSFIELANFKLEKK